VLVIGMLVIASFTAMRFYQLKVDARVPVPAQAAVAIPAPIAPQRMPPPATPPQRMPSTKIVSSHLGPTGSTWRVEPLGNGQLKIEINLLDDRPIGIPAFGGLANIPIGWKAHITFDQLEGTRLYVGAIDSTQLKQTPGMMEIENCGAVEQQPFGIRVQGAPGHYMLYVNPVLLITKC
jgi:hypothetical protein